MPNKPKDHKPIIITEAIKKRFWEKVQKTETCWLWIGAINPSGHGALKIDGSNRTAHRVSYAIAHEEIPANLMVLHKCHNASCVNPDHLYPGSAQQNSQDEVDRKNTRHYTCLNASKYNGVRWDKTRKQWISYVYINRKIFTIGRHTSEVDAARNHDRIKYMKFGRADALNFPEEYNLSH